MRRRFLRQRLTPRSYQGAYLYAKFIGNEALIRGSQMTNSEIIDQLKQLTTAERLAVIEAATRLIREDLSQSESVEKGEDNQLTHAAAALLADYESDRELTAFTALDGEDFRNA
jgi:ribonuclease HII